MKSKIDAYIKSSVKWRTELETLRKIALHAGLTEDLKWGKPCYSFNGTNLAVLIGFKEYCSVLLCKGALLKDPEHILVKAGENTQAARQARFTSVEDLEKKATTLAAYLKEAIAAEKAGLQVKYKDITEHAVPEELQSRFNKLPALEKAFRALTPGRQRAYYIFISSAKQVATRETRIDKCTPQILRGKGLND